MLGEILANYSQNGERGTAAGPTTLPTVATPDPTFACPVGSASSRGGTPSLSAEDVPTGLRLVRAIDRAVLDVARKLELRPMELYALLLLESGGRLVHR